MILIRAKSFISRRLRRNKGYESRLQPPYENNNTLMRCVGVLLIWFINYSILTYRGGGDNMEETLLICADANFIDTRCTA